VVHGFRWSLAGKRLERLEGQIGSILTCRHRDPAGETACGWFRNGFGLRRH
jgi:hypothetical protein